MAVACPYCGQDMDFLTVKQVAHVLGKSERVVRKYVRQGRFPGTTVVRSISSPMSYRIPATAVLPLVEEAKRV